MANFKKGSAAAKAFMAKLRAARGKTKVVKAKAKTKVGMDATENNIKVTSNVKNRTFTIKKNGITYRTGKFSKPEFEELEYNTQNDWANFLRTQDNYSKVKTGAVKKVMPAKKASSMHKDTKSHNVNIRVVSGIDEVNKNVLRDLNIVLEKIKYGESRILDLNTIIKKTKDKKIIQEAKSSIIRFKKYITEFRTHAKELKKLL